MSKIDIKGEGRTNTYISLGIRYKAMMVARGFSNIEGVDYTETYAPVVNFTSVHVLISMVEAKDLLLHHIKVVTSIFLII